MTFTYTAGTDTDATRVRLLIGDTDSNAPSQERLEDEEITALLTMYGSYRSAAAAAADALAAKFSRKATQKSMGQASLSWQRFEHLRKLAADLRASLTRAAVPFAGGISVSRRETNDADTDRVGPRFRTGMLDNPSVLDGASTS